MRIVFLLSLAGAMVNTGVAPVSNTQIDNFFATYQSASLVLPDGGLTTDRWRPTEDAVPQSARDDDRYPQGGDPMVGAMIGTDRSQLAMPVPDVPMEQVCDALASAAEEHGLPVAFLARLIWQESRFRQSAVSPVGAQGLAQFMPRTANAYGLENPFDPLAAVSVSARFLRELRDTFGNLGLAAAAYNGGSGRVQGWLARRTKLPEETRNYVKIITGEDAERWTAASNTVDLAAHLPARAPCEGIAGLSREGGKLSMPVVLANWVSATIHKAEEAAAAARVAAAKAKLLARAKGSKKSRLAAKSKDKALVIAAKESTKASTKPSQPGKPDLIIAIAEKEKPVGKTAARKGGAKAGFKLAGKESAKERAKENAKAGKPIKLAEARRNR